MFTETGVVSGFIGSVFATIVAGILVLAGLITPVWVALGLALLGLFIGIPALILGVRADERSKASAEFLEQWKVNLSSQVDDTEATLKQGT